MTTLNGKASLLIASLLLSASVCAQKAYVIDHLAIGLHESKALSSPIVRVLPTGTSVDVLIREEDFMKVRTEDGIEGWVDATYIMDEKPAQLALLELEAKFVDNRNELEVARSEIESLTVKLESMRAAQASQDSNEAATSETLREMQRLAEKNQALMAELEEAKITALSAQAADGNSDKARRTSDRIPTGLIGGFLGLGKWHWIMVGALMVLAFGLGGYLIDWGIRRRHGGFRI